MFFPLSLSFFLSLSFDSFLLRKWLARAKAMYKLMIYKYQSFHWICLALTHRTLEKMNDIDILSVTNSSNLRESFMHDLHWQTCVYLWREYLSTLQTLASRFKSIHYDKWSMLSSYHQLLIVVICETISFNNKGLYSLFRARHFLCLDTCWMTTKENR